MWFNIIGDIIDGYMYSPTQLLIQEIVGKIIAKIWLVIIHMGHGEI